MNDADANRGRRGGWRFLRSVGTFAALLNFNLVACSESSPAQGTDYRAAAAAPAAWQEFARMLQGRLQERLAGGDDGARRFQDYMAKRTEGTAATALMLVAKVWLLPDGKIERLEFEGLDNDDMAVNLRALLVRSEAGAPPPDMLQPLHLRLSLRPHDQERRGD